MSHNAPQPEIDDAYLQHRLRQLIATLDRIQHGIPNEGDAQLSRDIQHEIFPLIHRRIPLQAATNEMFRLEPPPPLPCTIDFTRISELLPIDVENLDLSGKIDIITQEEFIPGQEYYRVTVMYQPEDNSPPIESVSYYSIEGLQGWLTNNTQHPICRHPMLQNVSITQRDIERFTYIGIRREVGGNNRKHKSRSFRTKKLKKSIKNNRK